MRINDPRPSWTVATRRALGRVFRFGLPTGDPDERGLALLITLLALLILSLTGLMVARIAAIEIEVSGDYRSAHQAFYAAAKPVHETT